MQHKAGYWLCNCLPSEVEAFAEAVDATVLAEVERVLGVSFDPSTYGTDTNPVVTDFLAELLHDPNPMAAELGSVLGGGSFNATSSARRYDHFLNDAHGSDSYAAEMREAWGSLQAATACHLGDAGPSAGRRAKLSLPAFKVVTGSYDPRSLKSTLLEFETMRYGVKYTAVPRATAVDRFERSLLGDIQRGLAARDAAWHITEPGQKGPLRDIMDISEYTGMVFGTVGEVSKGVRRTCEPDTAVSRRC
eukprot:jgi/Tetstr1/429919/TSEL_001947.t1